MYTNAITFFFLTTCTLRIYGLPLSSEYGLPPVHKPFDTYGPPERSDSLLLSQPRTLPKPLEDSLILPIVNPKLVKTGDEIVAPPKSQIQLRDDKNQYSVGFQDDEGTEVKEQGRLISTDNGWEYVIAKTGSYKYTSPEGQLVSVEWVADEKGFRILSSTV